MAKKYKYVGDGMGVAGLPHEITDEEAQSLGADVEELLKAAIENGNYVLVSNAVSIQPPVVKNDKEKAHGQ